MNVILLTFVCFDSSSMLLYSSIRLSYIHSFFFRVQNKKMTEKLVEVNFDKVSWKNIEQEGLDVEYCVPIQRTIATTIMEELERTLQYFSGDLAKIK